MHDLLMPATFHTRKRAHLDCFSSTWLSWLVNTVQLIGMLLHIVFLWFHCMVYRNIRLLIRLRGNVSELVFHISS